MEGYLALAVIIILGMIVFGLILSNPDSISVVSEAILSATPAAEQQIP